MSLTARLDDEVIYAPHLTRERADVVHARSRSDRRSLTHPGCGSPVTLRAGEVRAWHFAHLPGACDPEREHEPESWQHRHLKRAIIDAAGRAGWDASEEHRREGGKWIADVHVTDGLTRLAFEVQWSAQSTERYRFRTERYAADGIRSIWLQSDFLVSDEDLREADLELERWRVSVTGTEQEPKATVRHSDQVLPIDDFVIRLLQDRLPERTGPVMRSPAARQEPPATVASEPRTMTFREFLHEAYRAHLEGRPRQPSPKEGAAAIELPPGA